MTVLSKLRQLVGKCLGRSSPEERLLRRLNFPAEQMVWAYRLLTEHGIRVWVMGGWGMDAIVGRQTRPHRDLDCLVPITQGDRARRILEGEGFELYSPETCFPARIGMVNARARLMIDLQLLSPNPDGSWTFQIIDGRQSEPSSDSYVYSAEGLNGKGTVAGEEISCITLEEQVKLRTRQGFPFESTDRLRADGVHADRHDLALAEELLESGEKRTPPQTRTT